MKPTAGAIFAAVSAVVVGIAVVAGLYLVGPPGEVRAHRLDQERIQVLQGLQNTIEAYRDRQGALPESLDAAVRQSPMMTPSQTRDPDTGRPFEYRRTAADAYQLCGHFDRASEEDAALLWRHGPGRACFAFTVKPRPTPGIVIQPTEGAPAS